MNDFIIKSCIAGAVGFALKNLINEILYLVNLTNIRYFCEAATLILPLQQHHTTYGIIVGLLIDFILTCWAALVIGYILSITGKDYCIIKGGFAGASSWLVIYGFFVHSKILNLDKLTSVSAGLTTFLLDTFTGIVISIAFVYFSEKAKLNH